MKRFAYFTVFYICLFINGQNNCRNLELIDVEGNSSATLDCSYPFVENGCIELFAEYTDILSTESYELSSVPYAPVSSFDAGVLVEISSDDSFSSTIDLPFDFCFFGNDFDQITISDNGIVSFDATLANGDAPFYTSTLPNPALYNNTIYGAFHDITNDDDVFGCTDNPATQVNECGEIRYEVVGEMPCRKFIINYNGLNHFNDETSRSTFQIVLFEIDHSIEIHINNKPINNENSITGQYRKYATIGIQNANGQLAYTPENRNNEIFSAVEESWRFSPNGGSIVDVHWYNAEDEMIGIGDSLVVCMDENTEFRAEAIYEYCNGDIQIEQDVFPVVFANSYPRVTSQNNQVCDLQNDDEEEIDLLVYAFDMVSNPSYPIEVYNSFDDAENGVNEIIDCTIILENEATYWIKSVGNDDCYDIGSLQLTLIDKPYVLQTEITICDINNDNQETLTLSDYDTILGGGNSAMQVSYYTSLANATNETNSIETLNFTSDTQTLYVRLDIENSCSTIESVDFIMVDAPELPSDITIEICDNVAKVNLFSFLDEDLLDTYGDIKFYRTYNDAEANTNRITNVTNFTLNGVSTLYVRVSSGADCFSIMTLSFEYLESIDTENDIQVQCDTNMDEVEIFDLSLSIPDMISETSGVDISYFTSKNSAQNDISEDEILNFTEYEIPISKETVFVRFVNTATGCVSVAKITLYAVPIPVAKKIEFEFCDPEDDGIEIVNLASMDNQIIGNQYFIENTYHLTEEDALMNVNPISSMEVAPTAIVYVRMAVVFEGEELCSDVFEITLMLNLLPLDPIDLYFDVCDNYNDGIENMDFSFYSEAIMNNSDINNLQFFTMDGEEIINPYNYPIHADTVIQVRQRDSTECISPVNLNFTFIESTDSSDILKYFCDSYPFDQEILNLFEVVIAEQPNLENSTLTFYTTRQGAVNENSNLQIENPENFELNQAILIIYGRIHTEGVCDSIIQIALKLSHTPYAYNDEIAICDTNNDGQEVVNVYEHTYTIFENYNYQVYYYSTLEDAENEQNPITEFTLIESETIYYHATHASSIECESVGAVSFYLTSTPEPTALEILICDNNNDAEEIYDLSIHQEELIPNSEEYQFSYYYTELDAQENTNVITDFQNANISGENPVIYVRVENENGCNTVTSMTFTFDLAPQVSQIEIGSCDEDYNLTETFDLTAHIEEAVPNHESYTIEYYMNYNAAIAGDEEYLIMNPENYTAYNLLEVVYIKATNPDSGCFSIAEIFVEIYKLPKLIEGEIEVCDNDFDGFYEIYLPEIAPQVIEDTEAYSFEYYETYEDALAQNNALNPDEIFVIEDLEAGIFVLVTNVHGCFAITFATFIPQDDSEIQMPENTVIENCDDDFDGVIAFNLTAIEIHINSSLQYETAYFTSLEDAQLNQNAIVDPSEFYNTQSLQPIYIRITEEGKCSTISHFFIQVNAIPVNPFPEKYEKCPTETIIIDAGPAESYLWSTGETTRYIAVDAQAVYSVALTSEKGCEATYEVPVYNYPLHTVSYVFTDQKTVVFSVNGENEYVYSLDGENWQVSNVFFGLTQGTYDVYVQDTTTECIVTLPFLVFDWYNIITPNADGINDTWNECGLEVFGSEKSKLRVFDRYGKTIYTQESNDCFEWSGKYQGRALPTDTYWFIVTLPDGREFQGYIAIKNYFNGSVR